MALVTRANASVDASTAMFAPQLTGFIAGENIDAGAPCYIKSSDNKVYMSNGTAANEAAKFFGISPESVNSGQAVTLFGMGARLRYGSGLTVGAKFYIAATAGRLDTAATTGDAVGVAVVISPTDIVVNRAIG